MELITEKAMITHNTHQHQAEATWENAVLTVQLGVAGPPEGSKDVAKEFNDQYDAFLARKDISIEEAEDLGRAWRDTTFVDFENGVKEKHPSRAEAKRINEEGSFPKMIQEDIVPFGQKFENCSFEAQEGYFEMSWQMQRAKPRALRKAGGTMFGPKRVSDSKELERRRTVAEQARVMYELPKSTQLVLDAINWRVTDKRLAETEYQLSGIEMDDARVKFERKRKIKTLRKCITRLSELVQPYSPERAEPAIGLLPSGRSVLVPVVVSYSLEGQSVEELAGEAEPEVNKPEPIKDGADLFYLCGKTSPAEIEAETEAAWDQLREGKFFRTCLSVRAHVFSNTMPQLSNKRKQQLLDETEGLRDRNDWVLDPKHVYRR
jgi:hypothetical protein